MKRSISMILAIVMVLALMFSLGACGSSASTPATNAPAATDGGATGGDTSATQAPVADGKVYNLVVSNHDASTSVGEEFVETFFNQISEASGGRLTFTYQAGGSLLGAGAAVDGVKNGAADICWNATSITVGVFPVSEFINVPLNGVTCARMGSKVLRDMYNEIPECADEYKDFHVIELQACSTAPLSTIGTKINTPADLKGLSIRSAGTVQSDYINMIGASASSMATSEVYEALSKGVVKGMTNDWHNIDCFNLFEVVDYCMDYPINCTSCFLLMNKDSYDSLPEDLQQLLDSYAEYGSDMAGYYWDCMRFITGDEMEANGVEVYQPTQEVYDYLSSEEFKTAMADWYVQYLNGYKLDGQSIYDKCMEIVSRYADEYADPFAERIELSGWDTASVADYN